MKSSIFFLIIVIINQLNCQEISCDFKDTIDISEGVKDGSGNYIFKGDIYPPGDYAEFKYKIVNFTTKVLTDPHIRGCVCKRKSCIRFCCDFGENCGQSNELSFPFDSGEIKFNPAKSKNFGVLFGKPCEHMYLLEPEDDPELDKWTLMMNGSIETIDRKIHSTDNYCFRQTQTSKTADAILCAFEEDYSKFTYYPIGMILSIPFLLLTLLVYATIPELRNLHGKCLLCYVCGLITLYISLSVVQLESQSMDRKTCTIFGYIVYISFLFCFIWLNIMCYDIWFVSKNGLTRVFKSFEHQGFVSYATYGFGSPIFIAILVYVLDTYKLFSPEYLPGIGLEKCWIQDSRRVEAIYVYIPMTVLSVINITLFVMTARQIWKAQKIARNNQDDQTIVKETVLKSRFEIYLRLFVIMGTTWCMESLSWIFQTNSILFYVTDIFNCLQGVFIFLICVANLSTRHLILRRCCPISYDEDSSDEANSHMKEKQQNTQQIELNEVTS